MQRLGAGPGNRDHHHPAVPGYWDDALSIGQKAGQNIPAVDLPAGRSKDQPHILRRHEADHGPAQIAAGEAFPQPHRGQLPSRAETLPSDASPPSCSAS